MKNVHKIEDTYLKKLEENGKAGELNSKGVDDDVAKYWEGNERKEIMYPITIRDLHRWYRVSSVGTEIGLCVQNIDSPTTVMARWESSNNCSGGDFFILPKVIVEYWFKNIKPLTERDCVVARIAKKESAKYYVYFHLGGVNLKGGGGVGGDDLAKGVRVPAP